MSIDINVKQIHKQPFENLRSSQLKLEITGNTTNYCLINALRRICIQDIPTYASCKKSITIEKNTSIFDNDYMKLRLSQLIIPNMQVNIPFLEDKYWKDVDFGDPNRIKHPNDDNIIEMYVNVTNETNSNFNVTSNHSKLYLNGEPIKRFNEKFPLLLIQLKPNQTFSCRCIHVLSIGKLNNIWAGGNIYYEYEESDEHKFIMTLESQGQMDEYELLYKACIIMKEKLNIIRFKLKDITTTESNLSIELWDEDSTMGELINTYLQDHDKIQFAGVKKPNLLIDMMVITYVTDAKKPLEPLYETLDFIDSIADFLLKKFDKLGDKYINFDEKTNK